MTRTVTNMKREHPARPGCRPALLAVCLLGVVAGAADARLAAAPVERPLRLEPSLELRSAAVGVGSAPRPAGGSSPAPLPVGAELIGTTWYDLQDMGSLGARVFVSADGRVHATFVDDFCELDGGAGCPPDLGLPNPFPQRAQAYAVRSATGTWGPGIKVEDPAVRGCCVTELFGGFGSLALTQDGRAVVTQHMNEDGCDLRGDAYVQRTLGGSSWKAYLSPITDPSYLFPQIAVNGGGSLALLGEIPAAGSYDECEEVRASFLSAEGPSFTCPTGWQFGAWRSTVSSSIFRDGRPAFPCIAASVGSKVGVAMGDFGGDVFLVESSDGSFAPGTVSITNLTNYNDASITAPDSTSTQYRPFIHCHLAYRGTEPHVVWSELQARRVSGVIEFVDWRSRIAHWSPGRGVSVVHRSALGEADRFARLDEEGIGPIAGFNTISVDWPQVGFSDDGLDVYVAWLRFVDAEIDETADAGLPGIITGVGFGDIAGTVSRVGGPWQAARNLTATPITDERFFSLAARNPAGRFQLLFQASATDQAGVVIIGDRGVDSALLERRIAFLAASASAPAEAVEANLSGIRLWAEPNPTRGAGIVRWAQVPSEPLRLELFSPSGRQLETIHLDPQEPGEAGGAAYDLTGAPTGVYFARLSGRSWQETLQVRVLR
ncbi:MAG: hypothetical protein IPK72_12075 [Candidatus Eisenbacteria bacterium]|nr:hypothetical protein [Candidatus Eisenbacteria bacterium]